jgi:hypothetical protein
MEPLPVIQRASEKSQVDGLVVSNGHIYTISTVATSRSEFISLGVNVA